MATFDLIFNSGEPKLIDFDYINVTSTPYVYGKNIDVDTGDSNSFLIESFIRIKNAPVGEFVTVTAYLNLQESDTPGSGYVSIPQGRLQTQYNTLDFGRDPDIGDNDIISKFMYVGAYGNKRYIRAGLSYTLSRTTTDAAETVTFIRKTNNVFGEKSY